MTARLRAELHAMTQQVEAQVGDGSPFFDRMDALLCQPRWYIVQRSRFHDLKPDPDVRIVVSGQWGFGFDRWANESTILVLPGGLRHGSLGPIFENLSGQSFVFLDNSCYLGRTRGKIRDRIEEAGGRLLTTLVIYDGSHTPIEGITGLYRYHGEKGGTT